MTQEEITEGNKLIAEFMGAEDYSTPFWRTYSDKKPEFEPTRVRYLRFHSSWGWLMPVVEKIESLGFNWIIDKRSFVLAQNTRLLFDRIEVSASQDVNILQAAFIVVVQFIKWYNKQQ